MSKHLKSQRYVYKITTSRLRRANWKLKLTPSQARENDELIALSESQLMRFIDELNGICDVEKHINDIKSQLKRLKFEKNLAISRPRIRELYNELDNYLFKKDYVCVVIDRNQDYKKIYKDGFEINGIKYKRFLATTGGVKKNTIVFVNEKLHSELHKRLENGRNLAKEFVPAKLEAYNALICSSSTPVSMPNGVIVVPDCITHFKADVIELNDARDGDPSMEFIKDKEMELDDSDGYGLAMPSLMSRWGNDIGEEYMLPGCVIRNAFCKGAVFPVDFHKFARDNGLDEITDIWGFKHSIFDIELILTESMLKLWDSYSSIENYLENCKENGYTFAITKASEEKLENERTMNYQFLQSYEFTDEEIDELINPTVSEIKDIMNSDYRKTILYAKGVGLNERNVQHLDDNFATALMINPQMINDPYIRNQIRIMIHKRINDAKKGKLQVPANYSLVSGDPYSLCQSMFGLEVTGLLKAHQIYSKYWIDKGVNQIVSFRAPMTSHNNIRKLDVVHNELMDEFYQYMTTPTIFNSWDTCADAMNGFDKDGDCVINTSFSLLVKNTKELPAVVCVQRKAPKCIPTEDDIMISNINSFGNAVGGVTNSVTSMFEVQARFPKNSKEYNDLDYRIKCGQLFQQNSIDKTKGIVAKDMPQEWTSWAANKIKEDDSDDVIERKNYNRTIITEKKPYFFKYVYPSDMAEMNKYNKVTNEKSLMRFRLTLDELIAKEYKDDEEQRFVECYYEKMPLGTAPCTINKICYRVEDIFDNSDIMSSIDLEGNNFDYTIMKNGDVQYTNQMYNKIKKIYEKYKRELSSFMKMAKSERIGSEERQIKKYLLKEDFVKQCYKACGNEDLLCNIVLDLCYQKSNKSKEFAWDICGDVIIKNLLKQADHKVSYPTIDADGDIEFGGMRFSMTKTEIIEKTDIEQEVDYANYTE